VLIALHFPSRLTVDESNLPEPASNGVLISRDQVDGVLVAMAAANSTAVTSKRIYESSLASRRKTNGTELAGREAGSTTATVLPRSLGNVLCPEKKAKPVAIG
jgi:hypothetical protein